jgi:hypothetical protein
VIDCENNTPVLLLVLLVSFLGLATQWFAALFLAVINFPRRRRHRKWTISDVSSLRHHNLELTHTLAVSAIFLFIGLVKRPPSSQLIAQLLYARASDRP